MHVSAALKIVKIQTKVVQGTTYVELQSCQTYLCTPSVPQNKAYKFQCCLILTVCLDKNMNISNTKSLSVDSPQTTQYSVYLPNIVNVNIFLYMFGKNLASFDI
jgi:hypothetical protein